MAKEAAGKEAGTAAAAEAFAPEPKQTRSKMRLLLLVVVPALLLLLLGGGGAYYFFVLNKKEEAHAPPPPPPKPTVFYNLPEFVVNLGGTGGRLSFLKLTVSLELEDAADVARMQAVMPRLVDNVQAFLRELRNEDVRGTAALNRLREELLVRVNMAAAPAKATNVLFLEILLQ